MPGPPPEPSAETSLPLGSPSPDPPCASGGTPPQNTEAFYRSLIEHSQEIIVVTDGNRTVQYACPSVERVLGYPCAETLGRNIEELVHPDDLPDFADARARVLAHLNSRARVTLRIRHRDGSLRVLEAAVHNCLHDPAVRGVLINAYDVTRRASMEAERAVLLERE